MNPIHKIDIPNRSEDDDTRAFIENVYRAVEEAGIDPLKILNIRLFPAMAQQFRSGEWTKAQFQANCRKLLIMNPHIALSEA